MGSVPSFLWFSSGEGVGFSPVHCAGTAVRFPVKNSFSAPVQSPRSDPPTGRHVAAVAGISKKLTMHIARHSFATEAGDKISIQMLQKLYRHSNITTTIGYQAAFINKDADDALDAVLNKGT